MKTLTLTQPWASLVAIGAKRIETRSWGTAYRGPLAIHAAKSFPKDCRQLAYHVEPFRGVLAQAHAIPTQALGMTPEDLPVGCVVAICELVSVRQMGDPVGDGWDWIGPDEKRYEFYLDDTELAFGNYAAGRYAWLLHDVKALVPIPARGALGLWEWDAPLVVDLAPRPA